MVAMTGGDLPGKPLPPELVASSTNPPPGWEIIKSGGCNPGDLVFSIERGGWAVTDKSHGNVKVLVAARKINTPQSVDRGQTHENGFTHPFPAGRSCWTC
jgi:hypothetical protein